MNTLPGATRAGTGLAISTVRLRGVLAARIAARRARAAVGDARGTGPMALVASACVAALVLAGPAAASAEARGSGHGHARGPDAVQLEHLDRGLVAAATSEGVFLSWRLLGHEVTGATDTGMRGADFHVYRDGERIATVTDSTNHLDADGSPDAAYRVAAVVGGTGRATAALRDFLRRIERPGRSDTVSDAARAALRYRAGTVIAMLS